MSLTTVRVLDLVERKLKNPERWVIGSDAEDKDGNSVAPTNESAQKFCLRGAVQALDVGEKFKKFAATFIVDAVNQNFVGAQGPLREPLKKTQTTYSYVYGSQTEIPRNPLNALPDFNDADGVTHDHVLKAIKLAKVLAKDARKRRQRRSSRRSRSTK